MSDSLLTKSWPRTAIFLIVVIMSDSVLNPRIFLVVDQKYSRKLIVSSHSIFMIIFYSLLVILKSREDLITKRKSRKKIKIDRKVAQSKMI